MFSFLRKTPEEKYQIFKEHIDNAITKNDNLLKFNRFKYKKDLQSFCDTYNSNNKIHNLVYEVKVNSLMRGDATGCLAPDDHFIKIKKNEPPGYDQPCNINSVEELKKKKKKTIKELRAEVEAEKLRIEKEKEDKEKSRLVERVLENLTKEKIIEAVHKGETSIEIKIDDSDYQNNLNFMNNFCLYFNKNNFHKFELKYFPSPSRYLSPALTATIDDDYEI